MTPASLASLTAFFNLESSTLIGTDAFLLSSVLLLSSSFAGASSAFAKFVPTVVPNIVTANNEDDAILNVFLFVSAINSPLFYNFF